MKGAAKTPEEYIKSLPVERREALGAVRKVILAKLPKGYEETIQYGMISYVVPHKLYPPGYHCDPKLALPYVLLGAQKSHMALHLVCAYGDAETDTWFRKAYAASGKKLDMGKACLRFKKLEDLPLDVIGKFIARMPVKTYIAKTEKLLADRASKEKK